MKNTITKDMTFGELVQKYPTAAQVLASYGLHCIGCHIGIYETIEQGSKAHGLTDSQIKEMLEKLNKAVS
jgi:hybrid cluster-associated redox disulfide protein